MAVSLVDPAPPGLAVSETNLESSGNGVEEKSHEATSCRLERL
jgi:hypothetical protein